MKKIRWNQLAGMNQHYRRYSYVEFLDSMCQCGIENLELWCGAPHFILDSKRYSACKEYRLMAEERNLHYVSLTAPSMLWQYQPAAPDALQFRKSIDYFSNGVRVAAELGCKVMAMNSGWGYLNQPVEDGLARSAELIYAVAETAQKEGVFLALESLQPVESNLVIRLEDAKRLYDMVGHPALKIMIDTVAVGVAGETPEKWFETFGDDIVHCHFIDGNPSGHLVWGDGAYPLADILNCFQKYSYQGIFTMELGRRYLDNPFMADERNVKTLRRFLDD